MGNTSSMLTQYDIEEVQNYFTQQEIVSLYQRFCQLDRNAKGFISADEFMSVPEFALNPLAQRLLKMVDGLNFKEFVAFLSAFSAKASIHQKIELIFKVYDLDGNGKVTFDDILEVLKDLTGSFMSDQQREEVLTQLLQEAGYTRESYLVYDDFVKVVAIDICGLASDFGEFRLEDGGGGASGLNISFKVAVSWDELEDWICLYYHVQSCYEHYGNFLFFFKLFFYTKENIFLFQ